jgi:HK97 family phage major capsid protein
MASTAYSREALVQTSPGIAGLVMNDLAKIAAIGIDKAGFIGLGSSNEPKGVAYQTGINTNAVGTNGGPLTWAIVVASETAAAVDNADFGTMHWVTTPGVRGSAKTILKSTTAGSHYLWSDDNRINGYQAHVTNQFRTNLTKGTSTTICHEAIFGDFSQAIIGEWSGAVDLLVNPYTYASQGMIAVHAHLNVDIAVRQPTAFVYTADITV